MRQLSRLTDALRQRPRRALWLGYLGLALCYTFPLYVHPTYAGGHLDWRFFHYLHEASRQTILQYGQLPLWNPWGCGGNVHLANAQTQFLSPYFALFLAFGVAVGQKLFILLHFWLGLVGMHLLVTRNGRSTLAAAGSAVIFGLCGFHAMRAGGGHAAFLPFLYLPWLILAYQHSLGQLRGAVWLGLIMAETVLEGGIYPTAFFLLLLFFEACYDTITAPVARWRPLAVGAIAGLVFVSVAAVKLGPVLQFLAEQPRLIPLDDRLDLTLYLKAFLSRSLVRNLPGHEYVWHEYINYVGVWPIAAALLMFGRRDEEPLRRWFFALLLFSLLMLGDHGRYAPYSLLHELPIYRSLRVPSRYGVLVVFHLALVFGVFLNWLDFRCEDWSRRLQSRLGSTLVRAGAWLLLIAAALDLGITNGRLWWPGFDVAPRAEAPQALFQGNGHGGDMWWRVRKNEGTPDCYEANALPTSELIWRGPGPQVRLQDPSRGTAQTLEISPNRWRVRVELTAPTRLFINQNHHRFWRLKRGAGTVVSDQGLLAVDLPAETQELVLAYWPAGLWAFATLSLLGILGSALVLAAPRLRRREAP